ncbi:serine protease [Vibrio sp. A1-b2]|uniref:S1 family peptidase n=1 Tax=Vibrio sp. A1-b2 TaxID=2912248 RepID=UPI001F262B43|nr:serine protease [Vibrio sp. A1-b2]MCF7361898.1 serine protease [Vibrio sp. A1-b2]
MKLLTVSLLAMSISWASASAREASHGYIVNGTEADITTFSSYVALFVDSIEYDNFYSSSYCGASILDALHLVTAAHCVYSEEPDNSIYSLFTTAVPLLQYETDYPFNIIEKSRVSEIYYPNDFDRGTLDNDIAILKLEQPLVNINESNFLIRPVEGISYRSTENIFFAVGHGNTSYRVDNNKSLMKSELIYVSNDECNYSNMSETKICMEGRINPSNGLEASTCHGDSGGPLYWYNGNNYIQVGLTSYGPATFCGDPSYNATSVFTEIMHYSLWIEQVLNGNEKPKFTSSKEKRIKYFDDLYTEANNNNNNNNNGGSVGYFSLLTIFIMLILRLYKNHDLL